MRDAVGYDRLQYLDGLRAVAVLAVVVFHAWFYGGGGGPALVARALQMGAHGVDLFFVLSGFCLAYPYLRRFHDEGYVEFPLAIFAAKRVTRIIPPYWLALFIIVVLGLFNVVAAPPPLLDIARQALFLDRDVRFAAGPFWTLPLEIRWYFLFPLALVAYLRAPRVVCAVAVGSYFVYDFTLVNGTLDFGTLPAFLAGIWIADLSLTRSPLQRLALPTCLGYGLIAFAVEPDIAHQFYAAEPLGVGSVMALVLFAGSSRPLRDILSHPALTRIGTASYGIYLLHDPILKQLETVEHVAPWLAGAAAVAISFGFSCLCERPFVRGPVRDRMVSACAKRFAAFPALLGVPKVLIVSTAAYRRARKLELRARQSMPSVEPTAGEVA